MKEIRTSKIRSWKCRIKNNSDIIRIKKIIENINNNVGEFLGIIKFANKGSEIFIKNMRS